MSDLGQTRADDDIEVVDLGCLAACALLARNALLSGPPRIFQYGVQSAVYMVMEVHLHRLGLTPRIWRFTSKRRFFSQP